MNLRLLLPTLALLCTTPATAQVIYPVDRSEILAKSRFDFKVEFPAIIRASAASITINGENAVKVLGGNVEFVEKEPGANASAFWIRKASLSKPGPYEVKVVQGGYAFTVHWDVFAAPGKAPGIKNVILLIGDGLSVGHRTAARILAKGMTEGRYNGTLAMDTLDRYVMMGSGSVDSIAVDSANAASAFLTGHKAHVYAMGVYADRTPDPLDDPRLETLPEILNRLTRKSIGLVTDAEVVDATPAALAAHTRRRDAKDTIAAAFLDLEPAVILGGGAGYFIPRSEPGSRRGDERMLLDEYKKAGYSFASNATELQARLSSRPKKLMGLFHHGNMDGALDRLFLRKGTVARYPDQPDLTTMFKAALAVLSQNPEGFFLMTEAGLIDKFTHHLDWERAVYDTLMFDQVVALALEFQKANPQTLVIVTGDHTHGISVVGTVDDMRPGDSTREKVGTMADAGFPNYTHSNGLPYPDRVDVRTRLFATVGNHPDYWETFRPKLDGPFTPNARDSSGALVANPAYANVPGAQLIAGNLPKALGTAVHTVDDVLLGASGPGSERLKGFIENSAVFRLMAEALGLGR